MPLQAQRKGDNMNIKQLEKRLDEALDNFSLSVAATVRNYQGNEYDIDELGRQVFYCLADFKNIIVDYMKDAQKGS